MRVDGRPSHDLLITVNIFATHGNINNIMIIVDLRFLVATQVFISVVLHYHMLLRSTTIKYNNALATHQILCYA